MARSPPLKNRLDKEGTLQDRLEEHNDDIERLRTRIGRIENRVIKEFNKHMDVVLNLLEYGNLEQICLRHIRA